MDDPFHVKGPDGVTRNLDEHYDTQKDVEQDPYGAWLAIQNQAASIDELEAEVKDWKQSSDAKDARIAELEAKLSTAMKALRFMDETISWEINPSNYDHQEVCDMNADWCKVGNIASDTLAGRKGEQNDE